MHGLVAARLGYSDLALRYFQHAAAIDLADTHTDYRGRVAHGRSRRYLAHGGLRVRRAIIARDQIAINPKLPAKWRSLGFGIEWRGRRLKFRIDADHDLLQATLESGDSMTLLVNGRQHEVRCEPATVCPL
jgi:Trehalose and maltose hydrolases (possible phosphorylases)